MHLPIYGYGLRFLLVLLFISDIPIAYSFRLLLTTGYWWRLHAKRFCHWVHLFSSRATRNFISHERGYVFAIEERAISSTFNGSGFVYHLNIFRHRRHCGGIDADRLTGGEGLQAAVMASMLRCTVKNGVAVYDR